MKKRTLALLMLVLLVLTVAIVGCSSNEPEGDAAQNTQEADNSNASNESSEAQGWEPSRNLEFVASYGPGGGHDTLLRTMQAVLTKENIITTPITVVNKPGGSGAVGLGYLAGKKGEPHYIGSQTSTFLTTPLRGGIDVNYKDFSPIALLGLDPYVVMVRSDSEFNTMEELLNYSGKTLKFGGTAAAGGEQLLLMQIVEKTGTKFDYVPFDGDGAVTTALLGNHIQGTMNNVSGALEYVKSGDLKALAVSTNERLPALPDVPTLKESGIDLEWTLFRGIVGPPDMPKEAVKWWEDNLRKLSESDSWKTDYLDKYFVKEKFMGSEEFTQYLGEMNEVYEDKLRELGIIE